MLTSLPQSLANQIRQANALKAFDCTGWAAAVRVPTIILSPKEDQFARPEDSKMLASLMSDAQFISLDCGHAALAEKFDEISDLCSAHISKKALFRSF